MTILYFHSEQKQIGITCHFCNLPSAQSVSALCCVHADVLLCPMVKFFTPFLSPLHCFFIWHDQIPALQILCLLVNVFFFFQYAKKIQQITALPSFPQCLQILPFTALPFCLAWHQLLASLSASMPTVQEWELPLKQYIYLQTLPTLYCFMPSTNASPSIVQLLSFPLSRGDYSALPASYKQCEHGEEGKVQLPSPDTPIPC